MEHRKIKIEDLTLDPANARKHGEKNIEAIKGSLKRFGQQLPILVKDKIVIAGNGTFMAAKELGWTEIDTVESELKGSDLTAYGIADNRTAELAEWDEPVLGDLLQALREDEFPLEDIGFDLDDQNEFAPQDDAKDEKEDEILEVTEDTWVKEGDLFQLGDHRLLCGDCTVKENVEKLMGGEKADMVFTDPPYGIDVPCDRVENVKSFKRQGVAKKGRYKKIEGDNSTETAMKAMELLDAECEIYWGGNYYNLPPSPCWAVWDKRVEENQTDINSDCELAWIKHKHKASVRIFRHLWKGMIKESERSESRIHPTQKPIALAEWCFEKYGEPKSVIDVFLGSGSTLIACEKTNRKCYGMEIDPHYCQVIIKRFEDYSGKQHKKL